MYRVLIVEDEIIFRLGLKNSIKWSDFDMEVVGDAANGEEGWNQYNSKQPDIILTDIEMPVMDGIELISRIREKDQYTKVIILTCHGEFELAQKAIKYGVSNYILKMSMEIEEVEEILKKVLIELDTNKSLRNEKNQERTLSKIHKENCLVDYLVNKSINVDEFASSIKNYSIRLKPEKLVVCFIRKCSSSKNVISQNAVVDYTIMDIINYILEKSNKGELFVEKNTFYIILVYKENDTQDAIDTETKDILGMIELNIMNTVNQPVYYGFTEPFQGYKNLLAAYSMLDGFIYFSSISTNKPVDDTDKNTFFNNAKWIIQGLYMDYKGYIDTDGNHIKKCIRRIEILLEQKCWDRGNYFKQFIDLIKYICEVVSHPLKQQDYYNNLENMMNCMTFIDSVQVLKFLLNKLTELKTNGKMISREVFESINFITDNFQHDIPLNYIAERVGISPNYLCGLFKKEMDVGISDYINQKRIEKAKELLIDTNLKSYQVGEAVGYLDSTYFCRIFKKITGFNPRDYRKVTYTDMPETNCKL